LVKQLFSLQHPQGHWGDDETKPYTAQGAVTALSLLHMLGAAPDKRTAAGCDSFLKFCQHEIGGFSLSKKQRSGIFPCTTGEHLQFLVYFGLGGDPRVRTAFAFLIEDMVTEDGLDCGRYQHRDCLWGAIAALNGLAVLPTDMQSAQSHYVVTKLVNALLDARYDFNGEHKRWLTFGVPRAWDLLSALKALAAHGYIHDARVALLLKLVLEKQDSQGRWSCGSVSRTWPIEKRKQPSKWVTLDVLRLLKHLG
jgi:adenylate kinase family enzyme